MTSPGTTSRWPGFAAPMVAMLLTIGLTWLMSAAADNAEGSDSVSGIAFLVLMPAPMAIAILWGAALLTGRPYRLAPMAAVGWFVIAWLAMSHDFALQLAGYVAAGLLAGLAMGLRWRLDFSLLAVALALCPFLLWAAVQVPVDEQLRIYSDEMVKALEQNLPAGASEEQRVEVLASERRKLDQVTNIAARIYPAVMGVGVLGQAAIILSLLWLAIRALGMAPHRWQLPPFSHWRAPFYVVWVLVVGLGLLLTRLPWLANTGLNLVLLASCVLSVQGTAVQFFVTGRMMSGLARVIYWLVMGFFFAPLVLASGVVLGLVDQWWDIRRLGAATGDDDDDKSDDDLGDSPER